VATDKMLEAEIARQVAVHIENHETVFLGPGAILRKVIPFLADRDDLCLVLNDLAHITFALGPALFSQYRRSVGCVRAW
jgi:DeoR/GlpR family transcriptional regulator of sugar metabolism